MKEHNNLYFLNNNLFPDKFLQKDFKKIVNFDKDISAQFREIKKLYNKKKFETTNEAQLENDFIQPALKVLGWSCLYQQPFKIQGRVEKPDFCLFTEEKNKAQYLNKRNNDLISIICESKAYNTELDNKKIENNPHFQLIDYLSYIKENYGFLTNGRYWRFYDISKTSANKVFYEVDLESIFSRSDINAFKYFYHIFKKENFLSKAKEKTEIEKIAKKSQEVRYEIEENLKNVIYGYYNKDSTFQLIGSKIYEKYPSYPLDVIYQNSLYLIFRFLFILYFEDKYFHILKKHRHYNNHSLNSVYDFLCKNKNLDYTGYRKIRELFRILDEGDKSIEIPVFNGGLFSKANAPLLTDQLLINNINLYKILNGLIYYRDNELIPFKRDFKTLSIIHLGSIYEGLLEFRFNIAEEETFYVEYLQKGSKKKLDSGFSDRYEYEKIKKNYKIIKQETYKKGDLYLISSGNSRKTTASYYTPTSLSYFMVKKAIDLELKNNQDILDIKIMDNACGSGHFLVESLNYITEKALEITKSDKNHKLKTLILQEMCKIEQNLTGFEENIEIDENDVLKRILLKKIIYGVDLNPFAVELAKLSLWIDTFVFGTPLSFLEHHIKVGNSLIGSKIENLTQRTQKHSLFQSKISAEVENLKQKLAELSDLKDTTAGEIDKSKQIFTGQIKPLQDRLNKTLNLINLIKIRELEGLKDIFLDDDLIQQVLDDKETKFAEMLSDYTKKYRFFNYEIEFPEVFTGKNKGFNIVIGNPPWDRVKFNDKDFFSQYKFSYRTCTYSKKKEIKSNWLAKTHISSKYNSEKKYTKIINEYCKNHYPYNKGAGDGNLFRFFVEHNLEILKEKGSLTYVIPSALMFEEGSINLRKYIFENFKLNFFYSFENRKGLFNNVHKSYKFALMQVENKKPKKQIIKTKFMLTDPADLEKKEDTINYDLQDIKTLSPKHLSMFELKDRKDLPILKKAYSIYEILSDNYINCKSQLHMTNDKDIFLEKPTNTPLYEGKMIWQFNSKFAEPKYWLDLKAFDKRIESKEIGRLENNFDKKELEAFCKQNGIKNLKKYIKYDREFFRLAWRKIAGDTNERTLILSMIPKNCGIGDSMYAMVPKKYILEDGKIKTKSLIIRNLFVMAIANSLVLDFIMRQIVQMNINIGFFYRIPIPQPTNKEILASLDYKKLAMNALKLTLYYNWQDFKELAEEFNISKKETEITEKQADMLQIENDCIVSKLYNITGDELEHICSTFKVLNTKRPEYVKTLLAEYTN